MDSDFEKMDDDMVNGRISLNNLFERLEGNDSPFKNMQLPDLSDTFKFVGMSVDLCEDFAKYLDKKSF